MSAGRILVVDDEPQIRRVLRATLAAEGYEVEDARTGEVALEVVRERRFDLILLDMNLPGFGGLQICRELRNGSEAAIIMLTVRNTEADKVAALNAGADDYVTKPFSLPELLARVRAILRRLPIAVEQESDSMHLGDIEINFATRRLIVRGQSIRLTPKEFELLKFFLANPNITISHTRLLQAVWGPDSGDQTEYLRVFVNHLRKKIEVDPANPRHLLTEPWAGYRFVLSGGQDSGAG